MECWNNGSAEDRKKKTSRFLTQYSIIPGDSQEGEGDEDGSFSVFRTPDGNGPSGNKPYLGIKNVRPLALDLHSDLSSLPVLLDQGQF